MRASLLLLSLLLPAPASAQTFSPRSFDVQLGGGLARLRVTRDVSGPSQTHARWAEPLPTGAGLAGLVACRGERCFRGEAQTRFAQLPFRAEAEQRGDHLDMVAGPLDPGAALTVTVRQTVPTRLQAGRDGIRIPAQVGDRIRLTVHGLDQPRVGDSVARGWTRVTSSMLDGGTVRLDGRLRGRGLRVQALAARCGEMRCLRYRMLSLPERGSARDVFVLQDRSGSMAHVDEAHRRRVTEHMLAGLPAGSRVRRVTFGWRAHSLDAALTDRDALPAVPPAAGLGSATRISSAWALIEDEVRRARAPLIVVVGDDTLGLWPSERDALAAIQRSGAELSVLDLVGRAPTGTLSSAVRRTRGASIETSGDILPSALPYLAHPVAAPAPRLGREALAPLRAGEERVIERLAVNVPPALFTGSGLTRPRGIAAPWEDGLAVGLGERLGVHDARRRLRTETPRRRMPRVRGCYARVVGSLSREMLGRLRDQWRPRVDACFRDARRRGQRAALRADLQVVVEHGEVILTRTTGVPPRLASCIEQAPAYTEDVPDPEGGGRYRIRFHFISDAVETPQTLPLREDVAELVDAL